MILVVRTRADRRRARARLGQLGGRARGGRRGGARRRRRDPSRARDLVAARRVHIDAATVRCITRVSCARTEFFFLHRIFLYRHPRSFLRRFTRSGVSLSRAARLVFERSRPLCAMAQVGASARALAASGRIDSRRVVFAHNSSISRVSDRDTLERVFW